MTLHTPGAAFEGAEWLFAIGRGGDLPAVDGLVAVDGYVPAGRPPEEVAFIEKAASYGARAVFFEAGRHGRASVAQAFVFDAAAHADDRAFAELHKRLWSWSGVPIVYRAGPGQIQLFRCAHAPDFVGPGAGRMVGCRSHPQWRHLGRPRCLPPDAFGSEIGPS